MSETPEFFTAGEVAQRLRVSVQTVYRYAEDGTLPSIRVGGLVRFPSEAIEAKLRGEPSEAAS